MYLFFDTETTGLPKNYKAPVTDLKNWPRMIQIAWVLCDKNGNRIETSTNIIKPDGFTIPTEASNVHGISTAKAIEEGRNLKTVLSEFNDLVNQADYIVAHNISFDEKIVGAEFIRTNINNSFDSKKKICTMKSTTNFCKIKGYYGYKWPTLSELHIKLFGEDFEGAHDALADIIATEKCFWKLKEKKII